MIFALASGLWKIHGGVSLTVRQLLNELEQWAIPKNPLEIGVPIHVLNDISRQNQRLWREFWTRALWQYIQEHAVSLPDELLALVDWGLTMGPNHPILVDMRHDLPSHMDWQNITGQFAQHRRQSPQWVVIAPLDTGGSTIQCEHPYTLDDGLWLIPSGYMPKLEWQAMPSVVPQPLLNELALRYFEDIDRLYRIANDHPAAYLVRTVPAGLIEGDDDAALMLANRAFSDVARALSALRLASSGFLDAPFLLQTTVPLGIQTPPYYGYTNSYYSPPHGEQGWPSEPLSEVISTARHLYGLLCQIPCIQSAGLLPKAETHFAETVYTQIYYGEQWAAATWLEFVLGMFGLTYGRSTLETVINSWVGIEALTNADSEKAARRAVGLLTHNLLPAQQYKAFDRGWTTWQIRNGVAH